MTAAKIAHPSGGFREITFLSNSNRGTFYTRNSGSLLEEAVQTQEEMSS